MSTSPVSGTSQNNSTDSSSSASASLSNSLNSLANEQTFLQLLVSQIQNQDPLNPTDSTQFLGQLTEFSQLEQLINIHTDMDTLTSNSTAQLAAATATAQSNPSGSGSGTNGTENSSN